MLVAVLAIAAAQVMAGKSPEDYTYKTSYEPSEPLKEGFRFTITAQAEFSANIADLDIGSGLSLHYYWNPASKIWSIAINLDTESEWGKEGQTAMGDALKKAGYKLVKDGVRKDDQDVYMSLYKKGNVLVITFAVDEGGKCVTMLVDGSDPEVESNIISQIVPKTKSDSVSVAADEDSIIAAEAVEVVDYDYDDTAAAAVEVVEVAEPY